MENKLRLWAFNDGKTNSKSQRHGFLHLKISFKTIVKANEKENWLITMLYKTQDISSLVYNKPEKKKV